MINAEKYLKQPHDISYFDGRRYYSNDMETAILTFFSEEAEDD